MRHAADPAVVSRIKELVALSDSEAIDVAAAGRVVNVPESWSLIWEKTPADNAYFILEGTVSIRRDGIEIATLTAGDFIGEMAIVSHSLRSASVLTSSPVKAINFGTESISALVQKVPRIGEVLRATAAQRFEANTSK